VVVQAAGGLGELVELVDAERRPVAAAVAFGRPSFSNGLWSTSAAVAGLVVHGPHELQHRRVAGRPLERRGRGRRALSGTPWKSRRSGERLPGSRCSVDGFFVRPVWPVGHPAASQSWANWSQVSGLSGAR
jgi:hypothetical protein